MCGGISTLVPFVTHPRSYYEKDWTRTRIFYPSVLQLRSDLKVIVSIEHISVDLDRKVNVGPGKLPAGTGKQANARLQCSQFSWEGGAICASSAQNLLD